MVRTTTHVFQDRAHLKVATETIHHLIQHLQQSVAVAAVAMVGVAVLVVVLESPVVAAEDLVKRITTLSEQLLLKEHLPEQQVREIAAALQPSLEESKLVLAAVAQEELVLQQRIPETTLPVMVELELNTRSQEPQPSTAVVVVVQRVSVDAVQAQQLVLAVLAVVATVAMAVHLL